MFNNNFQITSNSLQPKRNTFIKGNNVSFMGTTFSPERTGIVEEEIEICNVGSKPFSNSKIKKLFNRLYEKIADCFGKQLLKVITPKTYNDELLYQRRYTFYA